MEIIARTYKINEEYLNKLEMPLRLVFLNGCDAHTSIYLFIESHRSFSLRFAINCSSIKRKNGDTNPKFYHSSSSSMQQKHSTLVCIWIGVFVVVVVRCCCCLFVVLLDFALKMSQMV